MFARLILPSVLGVATLLGLIFLVHFMIFSVVLDDNSERKFEQLGNVEQCKIYTAMHKGHRIYVAVKSDAGSCTVFAS